MRSKTLELNKDICCGEFEEIQFISGAENSRLETFKYINKLLETEEKWTFINLLLKKLNSIKHKKELCKTICEGFFKLTDAKSCVCCFFNPDSTNVEVKEFLFKPDLVTGKDVEKFIENVNTDCLHFLGKVKNIDEVQKYFTSISDKNLIIVPIIYSKTFLGYLMLKKDDENFYRSNINFVNVFPEHIALILENISLYQESENRNKQKIQFLSGISHEFKTPLNSIIGFAEILNSQNVDPQNIKYINNILQSSKHLLNLIQDILDVSKQQYKTLELHYSAFNPKKEIMQIISSLEKMIEEKNIKLNYTLMDIAINADKNRFRQLIFNLLSNAIKFNKINGEICIFTYVHEGNWVCEISDTGDGISKRDYKKIFDFFSQVNRSQLKRQRGSGIGLSLCKMIVEAHGGCIDFKSQLKKGSTFWFSLPINK